MKENSIELNEEDDGIYDFISRQDLEKRTTLSLHHKSYLGFLLPHYSIRELNSYNNFVSKSKSEDKLVSIYNYGQKYRAEFKLPLDLRRIAENLGEIQNYKIWNSAINESQVKLAITSDNCLISYMKFKSPSEWYRERDILFIRHFFIH